MRRFLRASLSSHGFRHVEAGTAAEGFALATSHTPDVILLDLGLPDGNGVMLARRLREWSRRPILVISARGRETDKVEALDAGADDYLTKPFGVNELFARIRVALRHANQEGGTPEPILEVGALRIDTNRHEVTIADAQIHLTPIEYKLLLLLARNAGKVLTQRQILAETWGPGQTAQTHNFQVHKSRLRE